MAVFAPVRRTCALEVTQMCVPDCREHAYACGAATRNAMQINSCKFGKDVPEAPMCMLDNLLEPCSNAAAKTCTSRLRRQSCVSMKTGARVSDANLGMCVKSGSMFAQICLSMACPCSGHGWVPAAHMSRCAEP
eukprot:6197614-Pleurochrysis_carterae.AAC.1